VVDSFAIVELLLFLEKYTGGRLAPEDITLDHLDTIRQILDFTAARTANG
jgi:acyl carrier protein